MLTVSLNSDDPLMFNTTLRGEYLHALRDLGLARGQLAGLTRGCRRALRPAKDALHDELTATVAAPAPAPGT
jgi:aminodeoxyfutalosine deaminase